MPSGSLLLVLHSHLPYVIRHGRWPHGVEWLLEAAAECYVPILSVCHELRREGIDPRITLSISPVLLEQLADSEFPGLFEEYLIDRVERADRDRETFLSEDEPDLAEVASYFASWYDDRRRDYVDRFDRDLVGAVRDLRDAGAIGLQSCGATHGYFPLLGRDTSIHAQIQVALDAHWRHFRHRPRGLWMPECAYRPAGDWSPPVRSEDAPSGRRAGIESLLEVGGIDHTVVDAHTVRAGQPIDWYTRRFGRSTPSPEPLALSDPRAVMASYRIASNEDGGISTVTAFARHVEAALEVWSSKTGLPGNGEYLEFHKKYHASGHRYWRVTERNAPLDRKEPYRPEEAAARAERDGVAYAARISELLGEYRRTSGREGSLTLPFDTELFGHWWHEGPAFLRATLRELAKRGDVDCRTTVEQVDRVSDRYPVALPESSWGDGGDHRVWLNEETAWTWPLIWRAEREFAELVDSRNREDALEERALCQAARELLLMQASDWQFLITTESAADYASERIRLHDADFSAIVEYVRERRNGIERADLFDRLCRVESRDRLFPSIDLDHWQWKRAESALAAPPEG